MAETQTSADKPATAEGKPKSGKKKLIWILLAVVSIVAGAALPVVLGAGSLGKSHGEEAPKKKKPEHAEPTIIPFGDVAVNLAESRMTRYLRVKLVIQVNAEEAKDFTKELEKRKPVMKDWLISHLSGKSLKDVAGTVGVKRCQREIQERFEEFLFPHGDGIEFEVLFEEFVVQ
ncbi:MAG: flagellar basal body-associated FliL family protein [Gemmataceae bacterium]|nr:flagellar basal body-associated FliL family protein [Gemmataceae bacterium]